MKAHMSDEINSLINAGIVDPGFTLFKKGKIGNWRNYFTQEMSDKYDRVISEKLKYKEKIKYE